MNRLTHLHHVMALAFMTLIGFASCKKEDGAKTSTPAACLPTEWYLGSDLERAYTYDDHKRVISYTDRTYNGTIIYPVTSVSYVGEDIILTASHQNETTQYVRSGGKFLYKLYGRTGTTLNDTTYYTYQGDKMVRLKHTTRYPFWGGTEIDSLIYEGELPVQLYQMSRDTTGKLVYKARLDMTFEDKVVSFNPINPFQIVPGIDIVQMPRVIKEGINTRLFPAGGTPTTYTYLTVYDAKGNVIQVTEGDVQSFKYDCD